MSDTVTTGANPPSFDVIEKSVSVSRYRHGGTALPFVVLPDIYQPDDWTALTIDAARSGLDRFPSIRRVSDVGSGSGIIPLALSRSYPDRNLLFACYDMKQSAGRNLGLNYQLFGLSNRRPSFHHLDVRQGGMAPGDDGPPDLVTANIPQLPCIADDDWDPHKDPDDYHTLAPQEWDDPVRAFGLGLLIDVIEAVRMTQPGRFCVAFCRSSRVPEAAFDAFLSTVHGSVIDLGPRHSVRDCSTPFSILAVVEERFGLKGAYDWKGRTVGALDLRETSPLREQVHIGLRSCLIQVE
ncbi:hypothetical protein EOI86_09245 [Hwanghaeella grinnelliae]|uniref:Methyltransferase n=1 Tax=Hwanghaeella grinnelliae TaxID=2500179 RepID=A0A3S2W7W7_9PROT|nr:hypothetical protein [Hwanghaeella grinnelliae]RVU39402.1 hypothetical protein EOI86_09245 [Hwanghaeella grinnelliae]